MPPELAPSSVAAPMVPVMYEVTQRRQDLDDTVTLGLEPVDRPIDPPTMGQFTMLWAFGVGEAPISVAGYEGNRLVHTVRAVGAVTTALCATTTGDQIGVRGPFGVGWDLEGASGKDIVVVAGGLGLAPVRPIILELLARRSEFGRAALLIGARNPDLLLYRAELEAWRGRFDLDVEVTVDTIRPWWRGDVGVVTKLIDRLPVDAGNTRAFVCGPEIMMRFSAQALVDLGVHRNEIFVSLERNMHCAVGHCGHCQLGSHFVCKDGPVLSWARSESLLRIRER